MEMVYDARVQQLEETVSYGTLGVLNTLVQRSDDPQHDKANLFFINIATIVRNCYDPKLNDTKILDQIGVDIEHLRHCIELYSKGPTFCIFYFNPTMRQLIPDFSSRRSTPSRVTVDRLTGVVAESEHILPNTPTIIGKIGAVTYYGLLVVKEFSHYELIVALRKIDSSVHWKPIICTHCPADLFLMEKFPGIRLIESHTGRIILPSGFGRKVFKCDGIPFNRTTYKLLGDKEFLKPMLKNRTAVVNKAQLLNLRLRTEKEIKQILLSTFVSDPMFSKLLNWRI